MKQRPVELCPKCKELLPRGREIVGTSWIVCECSKPKEKEVKKQKPTDPFVFLDDPKYR